MPLFTLKWKNEGKAVRWDSNLSPLMLHTWLGGGVGGGRKEEHRRWESLNETWRTRKLSQAKRDPGPSLPGICPRTPAPD